MKPWLGISTCALLLLAGCTTAIAGKPGGAGTHTVACPSAPAQNRATSVADSGSAPRKNFRLTADKTTTQHPIFTFDLQFDLDGNDVTVPTTDMPVALSVTSTCPQGFVYRAVYERPRVDPDGTNAPAYQTQYNKIAGMTLIAAVDRFGNTVDSDLTHIPAFNVGGSNPLNSISDFNQATVGFPDQAIGVGAKWSAHRTISSGPAQIDVTAHYQLMSWHGNTVTVASQVSETGKPYSQTVQGHKITVDSLTGSGQGTITADLDRPIGSGSIEVQTVSKVSADDGSNSTISVDTRMTVH
jgi:uncharacterized protein DUF6263